MAELEVGVVMIDGGGGDDLLRAHPGIDQPQVELLQANRHPVMEPALIRIGADQECHPIREQAGV